ncbi:MAG: hypothetical protein EHM20_17655 [Alphaproteobacteria bacterium]|nr:MAG: hypothetical protein EHM20_17655 [Alphaproteobacteria bacterium]
MEKKKEKLKKLKKEPKRKAAKGERKIEKVLEEYKEGDLRSGSKKGPQVKSKKQALAIALSEARKAGAKIPKKKRNGK